MGRIASRVISARLLGSWLTVTFRLSSQDSSTDIRMCTRTKAQNQLELIDYGREPTEVDYAHMIQSFHRFLIDHLSSEGNSFPHNPIVFHHPPPSTMFQADTHTNKNTSTHSPAAAPVTQLLGIDGKNIIVCLSCKAVREKENMTHVIDMVYPKKVCFLLPLITPLNRTTLPS
jgi:hypothetical protein